jgi:hypothetical protein
MVVKQLERGKAAGPADGNRVEFLRDAVVKVFEDEDSSHPVWV